MSLTVDTNARKLDDLSAILQNLDLHFVITGASGWLGRASLNLLAGFLGDSFFARVHTFGSARRDLHFAGRSVTCHPLEALSDLPTRKYLWLHYAFLTKDRVPQMSLEEYVRANEHISELVEAAVKRVESVALFVPSSGAVYRQDRTLEEDLARNPYGALKVRDENRFSRAAVELGIPSAITRVFNLAGPYINKADVYVLASIIISILGKTPITIKADHPVIRSYVHIEDLLVLIFWLLLIKRSDKPQLFDTAGEVEIEVGDLARLCTSVLGAKEISISRPEMQAEPVNRYVGDGTAMRGLAQESGLSLRSLPQQIIETAQYLSSNPA